MALDTFEQRRKAVLDQTGGVLLPHTCCPKCFFDAPVPDGSKIKVAGLPTDTTPYECGLCGWEGQYKDLVDTVQAGRTKLSK